MRPATPRDAAGISACQVTCWRETYGALLPPGFFDRYGEEGLGAGWWESAMAREGRRTAVAVDPAGVVVGFASVRPAAVGEDGAAPPRDLELAAIYQRAARHGTGLGDRLMEQSVGTSPACLWVFEDNPRAVAFYARHGFVPDGTRDIDRWTGLPEVRMVR